MCPLVCAIEREKGEVSLSKREAANWMENEMNLKRAPAECVSKNSGRIDCTAGKKKVQALQTFCVRVASATNMEADT